MKNVIPLFLFLIMATQSCAVYHEPVSSLKAATDKGKVKVLFKNGQKSRFNNIVLMDSLYVGITVTYSVVGSSEGKNQYDWVAKSTPISKNEVLKVYVKDTRKSTCGTVAIVATPFVLTALIALIAVMNMGG